jgi:hypothetical protein
MNACRDVRRRAWLCPTRPVTPEVAGSSPVAPVSKVPAKASSVVSIDGLHSFGGDVLLPESRLVVSSVRRMACKAPSFVRLQVRMVPRPAAKPVIAAPPLEHECQSETCSRSDAKPRSCRDWVGVVGAGERVTRPGLGVEAAPRALHSRPPTRGWRPSWREAAALPETASQVQPCRSRSLARGRRRRRSGCS